ncbi:hypothetical protein E2F50_19890 [Rhizobium deserti]|uniref:Uncharacterized protein n=1 Tax=Rhizobium deserti TaxID=2547961 RepID=A0A4R5U9R0_9HYPH|nr:hypothetical protein [Rhizobium deserti]TDK31217.1 hypothetical protein E2F50_19890 [Rhizobium deserti]
MRWIRSVMLFSLLLSSCATPPLRGADSFPKAAVYKRIKCELYQAVSNVENIQKLAYPKSLTKVDLRKYGATLTLVEKASQTSGLTIGGGFNSVDERRSLALGSAPFPGFGASSTNLQSDSSKRQILFSDILKDKYSVPTPGRDLGFLKDCADDKKINTTLPIGQELGITKRLIAILDEAVTSPGTFDEEEMYFDFSVTVGAGGTFTFTEPTRTASIGGGSSKVFNETLKITMTRLTDKKP